MVARRSLNFASLDDAVADAGRLLAAGYDRAGQWSLGQCCGHIASWMGYAMDGFPKPPAPLGMLMWVLRHTVGPGALSRVMKSGEIKAGAPTMPQSVPPPSPDDAPGVAKLRETVARVHAFTGTPLPSPFFGPMDRDTWVRLNCVHAAHHLSFLSPRS
ncbi:MAG TPA: DUF1569 domain-containing protein [Gemmataceae bacterium]|jgi:hypothetical protein